MSAQIDITYGAEERANALDDLYSRFTTWRKCSLCIKYAERGEPTFAECPQCAELNLVAADERREGMREAAKLVCRICGGQAEYMNGQLDDAPLVAPGAESTIWRHQYPTHSYPCAAGPIYDALAAMEDQQ